ncbi:MAG: hypothetical protein IPP47_23060 [Bryobacterales bacterium]|nr:hypothetical protein [Bryobacterales bacterium]
MGHQSCDLGQQPGDPAVSDKLARIQFGAALLASGRREAVCGGGGDWERYGRGWLLDGGCGFSGDVWDGTGDLFRAGGFAGLRAGNGVDRPMAGGQAAGGECCGGGGFVDGGSGAGRCAGVLAAGADIGRGWGEYPGTPAQVFDTAVAVIALRGDARGRAWLLARQQPEGGWAETTRPPGSQSYAQHISTTAWALMALCGSDGWSLAIIWRVGCWLGRDRGRWAVVAAEGCYRACGLCWWVRVW